MERPRLLLTAALAWAAMHASGELHAQARGPPLSEWKEPAEATDPVAAHAATLVELDTWLRRLAGKFRYEGTIQVSTMDVRPVKGVSDCTGIGDGPGVQCVINVSWPEMGPTGARGPVVNLAPAMILYGIDPGAAGINFMQVDNKGLPEGALGSLRKGDVVRFMVPCVNAPPVCRRIIKIRASPDGVPVETNIETWRNYYADLQPSIIFMLSLDRVTEITAKEALQVSPVRRRH